jgi:putative transposase
MPAQIPEPWRDPRTPALAIVARGDQIETLSPTVFVVRSQSRPDRKYQVQCRRERWSCSCTFFRGTNRRCIHILAVRLRADLRDRNPPPSAIPECPKCRSEDVTSYGRRQNKAEIVPRYMCKACGRRFTGREGFLRRRADPEKIALALDLYFRGLSLRKITDHFDQVHGLKISPSTVYEWIKRYSSMASKWMNALQARTGERWHVDETVISADGRPMYLWNVLDADTRFLIATHVSRLRGLTDTRLPLRKAKGATPDRPMEVFTDGMPSYPRAIGRELSYRAHSGPVNPHVRVPSIRAKKSNNLVERLHGTEKDRIRRMRGFDGKGTAASLMEGFRVHYNLVQTHAALKTTPGVAAGLRDLGGFRWKEILAQSSRTVQPVPSGQVELEFVVVKKKD